MTKQVGRADGAFEELPGGTARRVLCYDAGMMLVEVRFEEGARGAPHSHPHHQASYAISGEFEYTVSGETHVLRAGESIIVPANATHGVRALRAGSLLDAFSPMREDFLPKS